MLSGEQILLHAKIRELGVQSRALQLRSHLKSPCPAAEHSNILL